LINILPHVTKLISLDFDVPDEAKPQDNSKSKRQKVKVQYSGFHKTPENQFLNLFELISICRFIEVSRGFYYLLQNISE
jgi:hypothetical protein